MKRPVNDKMMYSGWFVVFKFEYLIHINPD